MIIKLMILVLLFQLSLAQISLQHSLECKNPRSKICLLQFVSMAGFEVPKFPDLAGKHTLIIRSGDISSFNENFTSQFGDVIKVSLGRINIEALHIPTNWVSLNAESNQIRELIVETTSDDSLDKMFGDESLNSKEIVRNETSASENALSMPVDDTESAVKNVNVTESETVSTNKSATSFEGGTNGKFEAENILEENIESTTEIELDFKNGTKPDNAPTAEDLKTITAQPDELSPAPAGYKLESLNLANNKLQSIQKLKCMVNLKELHLDGNELEFIEMATFDGMTKLRKLSLAKNKINHISSPTLTNLPALEWLSLAFNRLTQLHVINWNMLQLVELDVSHNLLVKLDVDNFDQFVSLEKLAVANNSWTCYWLNEALKEISKRDFVTLIDRNDDPGSCPNGLPVEGICCSLTVHEDDETNNENLHERMQRLQKEQDHMNSDLQGKMDSFGKEWSSQWELVDRSVAEMQKRINAKEKEPKDDNKVTEKDITELNQLILDSNSLLSDMVHLTKDNSLIAQSFTQSLYTTIDLKNKLLAAMRGSAKLKSDLHQYEISFKAEIK